MELTPENKAYIDSLTHYQLLYKIRFGALDDPWSQGETGKYWQERRAKLRDEDPAGAVQDSKNIGWGD